MDKSARRYPRFSKACEVRYKVVETDEPPKNGQSVNISGGGLCMKIFSPIENGCTVAVQIELPHSPNPLLALGKVVWVRPMAEKHSHEVGVNFWWVGYRDEKTQDTRLEYVKKKLQI